MTYADCIIKSWSSFPLPSLYLALEMSFKTGIMMFLWCTWLSQIFWKWPGTCRNTHQRTDSRLDGDLWLTLPSVCLPVFYAPLDLYELSELRNIYIHGVIFYANQCFHSRCWSLINTMSLIFEEMILLIYMLIWALWHSMNFISL